MTAARISLIPAKSTAVTDLAYSRKPSAPQEKMLP
jgi:hypothetical protein